MDIIDRVTLNYTLNNKEDDSKIDKDKVIHNLKSKISKKIKVNEIVAKAISYYVFLLFFRWSIKKFWISEIEEFMSELIAYLPNLFVAIVIWFFWIRFANFIYDITFHALNLSEQKTAKIVASWWKIIILFFTLMVVLWKIWISTNITDIILIWFISMLALAWGLAFWLWGRDIAKEILESFRK